MTRNEERLMQIHQKMMEALNSEDQKFLESVSDETEGEPLMEDGGEEEYEEVFAAEDGTFRNESGDIVEPGEVFAADEDGNVATLDELMAAAEDGGEEDEGDDEGEDDGEYDDEDEGDYDDEEEIDAAPVHRSRAASNDEVPISELATRFPHLANEIDQEEAGMAESDRDVDIVNLKFENKLLKNRMIAERKIKESGLPAGFITIEEILGKDSGDMDRIIESRQMMVENMCNLIEAARPASPAASTIRESDQSPDVGAKILRNSVLPTL